MRGNHILIVDDDRDFAESLEEYFSLDGHEVDVCGSGEEALTKFQDQQFDLIMMDYMLPGITGGKCICEMQKIDPDARCVLMTAYGPQHISDKTRQINLLSIFQKPLDLERLNRLVGTLPN